MQPGDIAVLVRTHRDATRIRAALAEVGIPAVAAGKLSLFATPEARELHALLRTLMHGADDGHLRAALSTVLLGVDAAGIAALETDGDAMRRWQQRAQDSLVVEHLGGHAFKATQFGDELFVGGFRRRRVVAAELRSARRRSDQHHWLRESAAAEQARQLECHGRTHAVAEDREVAAPGG